MTGELLVVAVAVGNSVVSYGPSLVGLDSTPVVVPGDSVDSTTLSVKVTVAALALVTSKSVLCKTPPVGVLVFTPAVIASDSVV